MDDFSTSNPGQAGDDDFQLPDPKEVNRKETARLNAEKAAKKVRAKGEGSHEKLFKKACDLFPRNPVGQATYYLANCDLQAAIGRRRQVSEKTRTDYGDTLKQVPSILKIMRMPIQNFSEFGRKHVLALMRYWEQQGHREATIQWRVSNLRRFFTLTGRPQVLPAGAEWRKILIANGISAGTKGRTQVATEARGWRDRGVDPLPIIEAIRPEHPVVASQLDLCLWFGLRKNEATQARPGEMDKGTFIELIDGTKGGKPRSVDFSSDPEVAAKQREVLDRAKEVASKHSKKGILTIQGLTLRQMRNHINYVLRKFKITQKDLGVTQHGLRHQYGCDLFQARAGVPAPALGAVPPAVYAQNADQILEARKYVSRQMGHERPSITNAYAGSVPTLKKESDRRLEAWVRAAALGGDAFRQLQVEEAWIVGKAAYGLPLPAGEALQICVRVPGSVLAAEGLQDALARCRAAVSGHMGVPVTLSLNLDGVRPAEGVEILFNQK